MAPLNQGGFVPDAFEWSSAPWFAPIIRQLAQKGDSATGFWPLKRWLYDEDPPRRQRGRLAHEERDHVGQTSEYLGFDLVMVNNLLEPSFLSADGGYDADSIGERWVRGTF